MFEVEILIIRGIILHSPMDPVKMPCARKRPISIGIVGCGTIGSALAAGIQDGRIRARLSGFTSRTRSRAEALARSLIPPPPVLGLPDLVRASDLVAEAASGTAVAEIVPACLLARKDVFVISVGGLLGHEDWYQQAEAQGTRILVPSGAIAGLDGVRAAAIGRVDSVLLISRRPPEALTCAPYVTEHGIELDRLTDETVIFEGSAREACRAFPMHVNVPAALSLAGVGLDQTRVRILAVPGGIFNQHRIEVRGEFGRLSVEIENVPSPTNPRTGLLSIFSSIETLAAYAQTRK
jgi:aspartate dehydrogenase